MKKLLAILLVSFVSCAFAQQVQVKLSDTKTVPKKLIRQVKKGKIYLVDVRTPEEYNAGHLQYAQNIDFKAVDFKTQISKLDKNKPVYLYCRTGHRSGKALDTLKAVGFIKPYNIGGFENLKADGFCTPDK